MVSYAAIVNRSLTTQFNLVPCLLVGTSISGTPKIEEDWTLDALGNWTAYVQKTNG
jgi:hypothetical protein